MFQRLLVLAALLAGAPAADAQTLVDAAKAAEQQRKADARPALTFDSRDIDPRAAGFEILGYEVNDERWRRFQAADLWVTRALESDPALFKRLSELRITSARTIVRFIAREPSLLAALKSAGSDAHEYAFTQFALSVALIINSQKPSADVIQQMPAATRVNLEFVKTHERELTEMFTRSMQLKARMGAAQ